MAPNQRGRKAPKRESVSGPKAAPMVAVRMLVGANAGQVVAVTAEQAAALCGDAWQPKAELVARNVAAGRETR